LPAFERKVSEVIMARTSLALALPIMVLAGVAIAQEGQVEPAAPIDAAAVAGPGNDAGIAGAPIVAPAVPPPPAEIVSTQIYRDWAHRCGITGTPPAMSCVVFTQNGGETSAGPAFARVTMAAVADTGELVIVLDFSRPPVEDHGVALQIDGGPAWLAAVPTCYEQSCRMVVRGEEAQQLAAYLRRGQRAVVTFLGTENVPIRVQLSLLGFTAAANALAAGPRAIVDPAAN
jgi:invasion protein IalB